MSVLAFQETAGGSPRLPPQGGPQLTRPNEPMFNAPWPAVVLPAAMVACYALQSFFPLPAVVAAYGFSPAALVDGRAYVLLTSLFLHGGWAHVLMNAAFGLAFGAPVARFFGVRPGGIVGFFVFYLVCGMLSSLGYAAVHMGDPNPLVGASGAVSARMGAASRLIAGRGGRRGPILSRPVVAMGGSWVVINVLIAVLGSSFTPGADGAAVAWEAHLAGFLAGVLLIKPVAWLAHRG
jgi:membrane associated rhomboid family serine protease